MPGGAIIARIDHYNTVRLHSSLGNVLPIEGELRSVTRQQQAAEQRVRPTGEGHPSGFSVGDFVERVLGNLRSDKVGRLRTRFVGAGALNGAALDAECGRFLGRCQGPLRASRWRCGSEKGQRILHCSASLRRRSSAVFT